MFVFNPNDTYYKFNNSNKECHINIVLIKYLQLITKQLS